MWQSLDYQPPEPASSDLTTLSGGTVGQITASTRVYVSVCDAADRLGLSTSDVMDLVNDRTLKSVTFDGRVLVSERQVARLELHLLAAAI